MIYLLPIQKIFTIVAVIYALFVVSLVGLFEITGLKSVLAAFSGAFILEIIVLLFFIIGWRYLWRKIPKLNDWIYPDLNGTWEVSIDWNWGSKKGTKKAKAHIRQNFFQLSMELLSDESESETLMVKPKKDPESSRPLIYYIYRNESAQGVTNPRPPHKGAAILKLDHHDPNILKGNYFTDQSTNGQFRMWRESAN